MWCEMYFMLLYGVNNVALYERNLVCNVGYFGSVRCLFRRLMRVACGDWFPGQRGFRRAQGRGLGKL